MKTKGRLDLEGWLAAALQHLADTGTADFRVDHLCSALGVTKGSFYWHFENREDFVRQLADYWVGFSNEPALLALRASRADASTKLRQLLNVVIGQDLGKYDIAMRVAAVREPIFAKAVRKVDAQRFRLVKPLLRECGFRGEELTARTRIFVTFGSLEHGLTKLPSKAERVRQIQALHQVLVGR